MTLHSLHQIKISFLENWLTKK